MPPARSSLANETLTLAAELATHEPSRVARTVISTGSASRLWSAMSFHAAGGNVNPQPRLGPPRTSGTGTHEVSTATWVLVLVKSTSNRLASELGTNCTSSTFMLGGKRTPSGG